MTELFPAQPPTLAQMISAVERELGMRHSVYARRVADRKMTQAKADHEIACMAGVLALLKEMA